MFFRHCQHGSFKNQCFFFPHFEPKAPKTIGFSMVLGSGRPRPGPGQGWARAKPGPSRAEAPWARPGPAPGQRGALSGSCAQVPESASEGFSLSRSSPGGVDRVADDAGESKKTMKTNGFCPSLVLRQDRCLLLRQDRCLPLRQDRCLLLRQDRCLL